MRELAQAVSMTTQANIQFFTRGPPATISNKERLPRLEGFGPEGSNFAELNLLIDKVPNMGGYLCAIPF
jgi:hypothetical protein